VLSHTNDDKDFLINTQGGVGVGTTAPQGKLHITKTGAGATLLVLESERGWIFRQRDRTFRSLFDSNDQMNVFMEGRNQGAASHDLTAGVTRPERGETGLRPPLHDVVACEHCLGRADRVNEHGLPGDRRVVVVVAEQVHDRRVEQTIDSGVGVRFDRPGAEQLRDPCRGIGNSGPNTPDPEVGVLPASIICRALSTDSDGTTETSLRVLSGASPSVSAGTVSSCRG
jgi:hypothetical protein